MYNGLSNEDGSSSFYLMLICLGIEIKKVDRWLIFYGHTDYFHVTDTCMFKIVIQNVWQHCIVDNIHSLYVEKPAK